MNRLQFKKQEQLLYTQAQDFYEFYVDNVSLHKQLENFYNVASILENSVTMLQYSSERTSIILRLLVGKKVTDAMLKAAFQDNLDTEDLDDYLSEIKRDIADKEVLIYGCSCGNYRCGGYFVKVEQTPTSFIWKFEGVNSLLRFEFEKYDYYLVVEHFLKKMGLGNK